MSVETTLRKVAKQRRAIARPRLQHLLHWATYYALRPINGMPFAHGAVEQAIAAINAMICVLADRGAFSYFGIRHQLDLGELPIALRMIDAEGSVVLEVEPVADHILHGGARGEGWQTADELTIDDLSR